mgnify:CR=1 FL=1
MQGQWSKYSENEILPKNSDILCVKIEYATPALGLTTNMIAVKSVISNPSGNAPGGLMKKDKSSEVSIPFSSRLLTAKFFLPAIYAAKQPSPNCQTRVGKRKKAGLVPPISISKIFSRKLSPVITRMASGSDFWVNIL